MRVHHLLACIVVAATASATATPRPEGYDDRVPYGTHYDRGRHGEWVMLASQTPTRFGTEYFVVARETGWVRTLKIDATYGTVFLRSIEVIARDHTSKTIYLQRRLDRSHPTAYIDLGTPRRIEQLIVTTNRRPAGAYVIYGSPSPLPVIREVAAR